jgi:hypothetical protein
MGDNSYPMMLHRGHERITVGSKEDQERAEGEGYSRHHSVTAKKIEAKEAEAEQLGDAPVRNDAARMADLVEGKHVSADGETVTDENGDDVSLEGSGVTGETLEDLKVRVGETRDLETLKGMRDAEKKNPKYKGGRTGALEAIDRRINELKA